MLKTKIIAAQLENLTDARYFAAWGVDYMSFSLKQEPYDLAKIKEMMDWVEGPIFIAEYVGNEDLQMVNNQLHTLGIDHIIVDPETESLLDSDWQIFRNITIDQLNDSLPSDSSYIISIDDYIENIDASILEHISNFCKTHAAYLDCGFSASNLDQILNMGIIGLVLRGGEEEKVGVKTYDDLDAILESLEEE